METNTMDKMRRDEKISTTPLIVINKVLDIPVHHVWRAITEATEFKKWWGPNGFTCPFSRMDARPGGTYLNCMKGPDGKEYWSTGTVKEIETDKKLVITDSFSDEKGTIKNGSDYGMKGDWPDECLITFELEEADGATKLRLTHEGIPKEEHENCKQGWNECLEKLEKNIK
jgi:uncharacterized protein YndB with AHSA1/START domain